MHILVNSFSGTMSMKLFYAPVSPYARKCRIMIEEAGLEVELINDAPTDPTSVVSQHNPLGKVPALIMDDDSCIFDSSVIVEVIAAHSATLIPSEFSARIAAKRWEAVGDGICDAALSARMEKMRKEQTAEGGAFIARQLGKIDLALKFAAKELGNKTTCVGSQFTLADAALISALQYLSTRFPEIDWKGAHPNLARYMAAHASRPSVDKTKPVV
jgi:glutathione S-transferase